MMQPRIYQAVSLAPNQELTLDLAAAHHLLTVLRAKVQDKVCIFNGEGGEYQAVISKISKKSISVQLQNFHAVLSESPCTIYLAQALARSDRMDLIVQKTVELGVKKILPIITERCQFKLQGQTLAKKRAHWQAIAISAAEQCGRDYIPEIMLPLPLKALPQVTDAGARLFLSPYHANPLKVKSAANKNKILVLVGPEGGLSSAETDYLINNEFNAWHLGMRVLRTETAAIAATSLLQYCYGDLGGLQCPPF